MPSADDHQLQKKARHRLIGAVVFVAVAASLLILAMDAEPPDNPTPTLTIPSQNGMEVFPLDGSLALPQTPPPIPDLEPPPLLPAPPLTAPAVQPASPAAVVRAEPPRPATVTATAPAAATVAPRPTPTPTPAASAPAPTVSNPVTNPALHDANRAAAILAGRSPDSTGTSPATANATSYVVQVIASSNKDTVRDTVEKLRALKLPVYTETASGNMTRVRVGPYTTRSEAERAEEKINQDGKIVGTKIYPQSPS